MLLGQTIAFGTLMIFSVNLIIEGNCERLKSIKEIPRKNRNEGPNFSFLELFIDYLLMDTIRERIDQLFPNDDLFFIGQTLAWVGQLMIIREELVQSTSRTIRLIPFSGSFFRISNETYVRDPENFPTREELEYFKIYLESHGLDPRSIVDRYKRTGRRTVFAEKVRNGVNLRSFMEIFFSLARLQGISPTQMRNAVKVFIVTVNLSDSEDLTLFTIRGYTVDLLCMDFTSIRSIITIERTAYPESYGHYVNLVPDYPHQLWTQPPPGLSQQHEQRRRLIINGLRDIMQITAGNLRSRTNRETSNEGTSTTASPEMVQRTNADLELVCQYAGPSRESRFKRDLSSHNLLIEQLYLIWTFDKNALETLEMESATSLNKESFDDIFENQLIDSSSTVGKILSQACGKDYNSRYQYSTDEESVPFEQFDFGSVISGNDLDYNLVDSSVDSSISQLTNTSSSVSKFLNQAYDKNYEFNDEKRVYFSTNRTWNFWCMKRNKLFNRNENYEKIGIVQEIAISAARIFSGQIKTRDSIGIEAESLVRDLRDFYPEFPVEYLIDATAKAALDCSKERIKPTLESPNDDGTFLGQIILAWFDQASNRKVKTRVKELLY